jgi:integrase
VASHPWCLATIGIRMPLKFRELEQLSASAKLSKKEVMAPDGTPSLYAFARATGRVTWIVRITIGGKRQNLTIGAWPEIKAETARGAATAVRGLVKAGFGAVAIKNALALSLDPLVIAQLVRNERISTESATPTFKEVADQWFEEHANSGISNDEYRRQVLQQIRDFALPSLGQRPVNELKRAEILAALTPIWNSKRTVGKRLRGHIERILDFAVDRGWCEFNACPPIRSFPTKVAVINHHAALEPERAPLLWRWLEDADRKTIAKAALSLMVLTGKRTIEIRTLRWSDIDFQKAIWTTPADKMKMRKAHRQPLSTAAQAVIQSMRQFTGNDEFVFGPQLCARNAICNALKEFDQHLTAHGLRATLGSWMAEKGIRKDVSEHILAHQPKAMDAAYQRSDLLEERRQVLEDWGQYVTQS